MDKNKINEKEHFNNSIFLLLDSDILQSADKMTVLEHLQKCDQCASNYADYLSMEQDLSLPMDFEINTKNFVLNSHSRKAVKRHLYSDYFKLAMAATIALFIYSSGIFDSFSTATVNLVDYVNESNIKISQGTSTTMDKLNESLSNFSIKINNTQIGAKSYEKE